jgi:EmrB/QacA subfamily drug resistance transporter
MSASTARRRQVTFGVLGGTFLAAIEATIVATAMPTVVAQLGGLAHYSWVFAAYLLTSTVTVPLWGKLSDLYGRRRFYLTAISLFLLGSALSGAARSMPQLIVFRAIQGLGAGGLLPLGMAILADLYTLHERARMQGLISGVWGVASVVGPTVGGYLTEHLSWRWVFYLNLPFGAAAAWLVGTALADRADRARARIDYRGALLMSGAVVALLVALSRTGAGRAALDVGTLLGLYLVATALGAAFVRLERRAAEPIVPLDLLSDRLAGPVTLCSFLLGVAMFGAISFVPLFVQGALGANPTRAGTVLTPLLLGWVTMSIVSGRLLGRTGYRPLVLAGISCVSLGFCGLALTGRANPWWRLHADLMLMGLGMGMANLSLLLAMQNAVERSRLGAATSLAQFTRTIGGAVGVAIMGAVVAASLPPARAATPVELERALHRAFVTAVVFSLAALAVARRIPAGLPVRSAPPSGAAPGGQSYAPAS